MAKLENLNPHRVFHYFEQLSAIHRGSGDMDAISQYCIDFAKAHNLRYHTDDLKNVVIYKDGSKGYENSGPVILQGHLDMVCQKTPDSNIDFLSDGIDIYVDREYITANGTTLGADNGIAVAMVLSILENDSISHPPIEAVFTTDEETGMYGAKALDMNVLSGRRMINLDSEEENVITVSCAGGSDLRVRHGINREEKNGDCVTITLKGLRGGHSGIEINSGKINANILMGETLHRLSDVCDFEIISLNGGDKPNAITNLCTAQLFFDNYENCKDKICAVLEDIKSEVCDTEKDVDFDIEVKSECKCYTFGDILSCNVIDILNTTLNGVVKMSENIENLVETSLNIGILSTSDDEIMMHFSLRSNKNAGLYELEENMCEFFKGYDFSIETFGHYPPWEYRENSQLRDTYFELYKEIFKKEPKVEAIHAGLECGIFASNIKEFDCIAIGPDIFDAHTVNEKLSIKSTQAVYDAVIKLLSKLQ